MSTLEPQLLYNNLALGQGPYSQRFLFLELVLFLEFFLELSFFLEKF